MPTQDQIHGEIQELMRLILGLVALCADGYRCTEGMSPDQIKFYRRCPDKHPGKWKNHLSVAPDGTFKIDKAFRPRDRIEIEKNLAKLSALFKKAASETNWDARNWCLFHFLEVTSHLLERFQKSVLITRTGAGTWAGPTGPWIFRADVSRVRNADILTLVSDINAKWTKLQSSEVVPTSSASRTAAPAALDDQIIGTPKLSHSAGQEADVDKGAEPAAAKVGGLQVGETPEPKSVDPLPEENVVIKELQNPPQKPPGHPKVKKVQDFNRLVRELELDKKTDEEKGDIFEQWHKDKFNSDDPWLLNCRKWGNAKPSWEMAWSLPDIRKNLKKRIQRAKDSL